MKHLILALALLAISAESWAAPKCSAFLKDQVKITPIARITFSTNNKQNVSIAFSRQETILDAEFTKSFLTSLNSYFEGKSTTTSRLEERSVMKESDSAKLLEKSGLDWQSRDPKEPGEDFTTITTYSGKFIMDSQSDVEVSAKMRARKYFAHQKGETDTSNMTSVFGGIGSLELKISNVAGVTVDGFTAFPNSVFKPRIFISDAGLKALSKVSVTKMSKSDFRSSLVDELHALEVNGKKMNSNRAQVEEFVNAVALLLEKNPHLFEVQTVVAYNRDSYSAHLDNGTEYQYTLDRNIRIFEPDPSLSATNIITYLKRKPLHKVKKGVAFAELKSPMIEKTENTDAYQKLSYALFSKHRAEFTKGKGKHSLGSRVRSTLAQTSLSEQLHTEGLLFYLIKGTGNLPTPPNRKRLVEMGELNIALPLKIADEDHRLIVGYRPHIVNGKRSEIVASLQLIDSLGRKVSLDKEGIQGIIAKSLESEEPSTITIDNQALTFPSIVDPSTLSQFNDFFDRFYTNHSKGQANPREIESLSSIDSSTQLKTYTKKMNFRNTMSFLKDRASKVIATGLLVGAVTLGPQAYEHIKSDNNASSFTNVFGNRYQDNMNLRIQVQNDDVMLRGYLNKNGEFVVSPTETIGPLNPDLTLNINAIKDVEISPEGAESPGVIIFGK